MMKFSTFNIQSILWILFLVLPGVLQSQNSVKQRRADFFLKIEELLNQEKARLMINNYVGGDKDSIASYLEEISGLYSEKKPELNIAQQINWQFEMGLLNRYLQNWHEAEVFQLAVQQQIDSLDNRTRMKLAVEFAEIYRHKGDKKKSNDYYFKLVEDLDLSQDSARLMSLYTRIIENYENLHQYDKAMERCIDVYNYNLRNERLEPAAYNLIQMGRISSHMESDTSFLEYYHMGVKLAYQSGNWSRVVNNLINTGLAYKNAQYPEIGLDYLLEAQLLSDSSSEFAKLFLLNALSTTYFQLDSLEKTYNYAREIIKISRQNSAIAFLQSGLSQLADYYERIGKIDSALILNKEVLAINEQLNNHNSNPDIYKKLSDLSLLLKDYNAAIAYLDTSFSEYQKQIEKVNYEKLSELREKSDYYIHRNRISQLVSENKIQQEKNLRLWIIVISIAFALGVILVFTRLLRKRLFQLNDSYVNLVKKNLELDKLNQQLNHCEKNDEKKNVKISGEEVILKKLKQQLSEQEVFVDPNISLKSLSDLLETNTTYLSTIINNHYQCNFRSLINKHRINKARKMLLDNRFQHYSMEGVALEVGFKTRSVFYQTFKTVTGISPGVYVEKYKQVVSDQSNED